MDSLLQVSNAELLHFKSLSRMLSSHAAFPQQRRFFRNAAYFAAIGSLEHQDDCINAMGYLFCKQPMLVINLNNREQRIVWDIYSTDWFTEIQGSKPTPILLSTSSPSLLEAVKTVFLMQVQDQLDATLHSWHSSPIATTQAA